MTSGAVSRIVTTDLSPLSSLDDVPQQWIETALAGVYPDVRVDGIDMVDVHHGTTSRARLRVSYQREPGPTTVFLKAPTKHRLTLGAYGVLLPEAKLQQRRNLLPIEAPAVYASVFDRRKLTSTLVLEDVTLRGGCPNDALTALTVDDVAAGLEQLATLHAKYWDSRLLSSTFPFLPSWKTWTENPLVLGPMLATVRMGAAKFSRQRTDLLPNTKGMVWLWRSFLRKMARGPQTLIHGDAHVGNTYSISDTIGFLDWQCSRVGCWVFDVGYFIVSSLTTADRRIHERELVWHYIDVLNKLGVDDLGEQAALDLYRASPAHGLVTWLCTLGSGSYQSDEICMNLIGRFADAWIEHDTASLS